MWKSVLEQFSSLYFQKYLRYSKKFLFCRMPTQGTSASLLCSCNRFPCFLMPHYIPSDQTYTLVFEPSLLCLPFQFLVPCSSFSFFFCLSLGKNKKVHLWGPKPTYSFPLQTGNMVIQIFGFCQGEDLLWWSRWCQIIFIEKISRARKALWLGRGHLQAVYKMLQWAKATLPHHFLCNPKSQQQPEGISFFPNNLAVKSF